MLNANYKQQVIKDLQKLDREYTVVFKNAVLDMERLQNTRNIAIRTIQSVERYVVALANRPRNFDTQMGLIKVRYINFIDACKEIQELEAQRIEQSTRGNFGIAGTFRGFGVAALGITAAKSVAMTFGTVSTGTAIASLSGVAETNTALAWLSGGALAARGASIAGGQALVALSGPVGWVVGGDSLAGSLLVINMSNKEIAKKTEESIKTIKKEMERIKEIDAQVISWNEETKKLSNVIATQLNKMRMLRKRDYTTFTDDEINELISIFNSTEVLSKKLGETIGGCK